MTLRDTFLFLRESLDSAAAHLDDCADNIACLNLPDDSERLQRASILVRTVSDVLAEMLGDGAMGDPLSEKIVSEAKAASEEVLEGRERNTTTCAGCGDDFPDRDMLPRGRGGEGEFCPKCAEASGEFEEEDK